LSAVYQTIGLWQHAEQIGVAKDGAPVAYMMLIDERHDGNILPRRIEHQLGACIMAAREAFGFP